AAGEAHLLTVEAPMVGTFYRAPSPDAPPFVRQGDRVKKGQVVCIIEAMKLMNEIESKVAGRVVKVLVENTQPVEYGQPLFLLEPGPGAAPPRRRMFCGSWGANPPDGTERCPKCESDPRVAVSPPPVEKPPPTVSVAPARGRGANLARVNMVLAFA